MGSDFEVIPSLDFFKLHIIKGGRIVWSCGHAHRFGSCSVREAFNWILTVGKQDVSNLVVGQAPLARNTFLHEDFFIHIKGAKSLIEILCLGVDATFSVVTTTHKVDSGEIKKMSCLLSWLWDDRNGWENLNYVQDAFLLDIVVLQDKTILKLATSENNSLLVSWDP